MFTLVYTHHGCTLRHELKAGDTIVGRALTCDVALDDPSISRRHARFRVADDRRCILTDLAGRNTTSVNRQVVSEVDVTLGDTVELGRMVLRVDGSAGLRCF